MLLILSGTASAQQSAAPPIQAPIVYDAAYYARYSPSTALDMVRQTPGFTLEETGERRGFAGASGNMLVDGERPIAKSQTLANILQRIPAAQVLRIEVLRGGEAGADALGHATIVNVVRTRSAGQGVYQVGTEYAGRAPVPNGWASWSGRFGTTDYSLGANGYSLMRNLPGNRLRLDGDGSLIATLEEQSPREFYEVAVNAEVSRPMLGGQVRATGKASRSRYHQDSTLATFSPSGLQTEFELNPYTERKRTLEGSLAYDRPLGAWDLSLSGLLTRRRFTSDTRSSHSGVAGQIDSVFTQAIARRSGESIARVSASRTLGSEHRIEAGAEFALNTLAQQLALTLDLGSGPFPIPVLNSNLAVKERRGEAYVVHNWTPGRWSVETRLTNEASRLSFSGDTDQSVRLAYVKPSLQVTRRLGGQNQLRARIYRDVGQLDFLDFVSSVSVVDEQINGGNPDLRPETSWRAETTLDLRFAGDGAIGLTLFRYWLSDAVDLIPAGPSEARFDAPGNIGKGNVVGAQFTLRLPLKALLPGASLSAEGMWRRSRVTDPLTGERRRQSDHDHHKFKAEFRHDLAKRRFAWGARYTVKPEKLFYRVKEIERKRESPSLDLWIETTAIGRLKAGLTVGSLFDQAERRNRTFFEPDRNGSIGHIERSRNQPGRWAILTLSGSL
ncbi:MAG: TonB-dependent receptor [Pseudomonadota bacterium]|nr:TonB-dependent receptor [Pseudomonadota bacterium]